MGSVPIVEPAICATNTSVATLTDTSNDFANAGSTGAMIPLPRPDAPAGRNRENMVSRVRVLEGG